METHRLQAWDETSPILRYTCDNGLVMITKSLVSPYQLRVAGSQSLWGKTFNDCS